MGRMDGKVVIVTGGTRGMGEAELRGLVAEGARVVFGGRDKEAGSRIAADLGGNAIYVPMDVSLESDWERAVATAVERFGGVHGLVNNAGVQSASPIAKIRQEDIDRLYRINQLGPILGIKHVVGPMRAAGGGSIVNIGSPAGVKGLPMLTAYAATKAALHGITRSVAVELAPENIRVNIVVPGFFDTEILAETTGGKGPELAQRYVPMKRIAQPEEMVGTIVYLLSDDSRYVTGTEIRVDGAYTI
jgi:3alpha(or 20beta)-hydroxysteroid dehydrogenase